MNISSLFTDLAKQAKVHSPEILTAFGVTGVISTSYLAAKAATKVARDEDADPWASNKEKIKKYWKVYLPAGISGVVSIGCIIGGSQASGRRTAAAVTAFSVTERAFAEYKDKVVEQIGKGPEQKVRDELVQKKINENPPGQIIMVGSGHVLCCELYTGRYFRSDMETLKRAQNEVNSIASKDMYATLSDFYDLLGLPHTSHSDYTGWDTERGMELVISAVMTETATPEPCMGFDYNYIKPLN